MHTNKGWLLAILHADSSYLGTNNKMQTRT